MNGKTQIIILSVYAGMSATYLSIYRYVAQLWLQNINNIHHIFDRTNMSDFSYVRIGSTSFVNLSARLVLVASFTLHGPGNMWPQWIDWQLCGDALGGGEILCASGKSLPHTVPLTVQYSAGLIVEECHWCTGLLMAGQGEALHCGSLNYTPQNCTELYWTTLHRTALNYTELNSTELHWTILLCATTCILNIHHTQLPVFGCALYFLVKLVNWLVGVLQLFCKDSKLIFQFHL